MLDLLFARLHVAQFESIFAHIKYSNFRYASVYLLIYLKYTPVTICKIVSKSEVEFSYVG